MTTPMPAVVKVDCLVCNSRCKKAGHWPKHVSRACVRKRDYTSLQDAIDTAVIALRARGRHVYVYWCPLGDHWHLSSNLSLMRLAVKA